MKHQSFFIKKEEVLHEKDVMIPPEKKIDENEQQVDIKEENRITPLVIEMKEKTADVPQKEEEDTQTAVLAGDHLKSDENRFDTNIDKNEFPSMNLDNEYHNHSKIHSPFSSALLHLKTSFKSNLKKVQTNKFDKRIKNLKNLHEFLKQSPSKINVNLLEYIKLNTKLLLKSPLDDKEKLFLKGEKIYEEELDIVHILKKIQEIEKMKMVLFNEEQLTLFNLIDKPMIYVDEIEQDDNWESCSAQLKMSKMIHSSKTFDDEKLKRIFQRFLARQKNNEMNDIDKRLLDLIDTKITEFAKNFTSEE